MRKRKQKNYTPLVPAQLVGTAFKGLNTEVPTAFGADHMWSSVLENIAWNQAGDTETRKGTADVTTVKIAASPIVGALHEYVQTNGATMLIAITASTFQVSTNAGSTWAAITGSVSMTNGPKWTAVSFNNVLYLTAVGYKVHYYTGAGNVTEIATSPVTTGVMTAGFGRLWVAEDGTGDIRYSALLDGSLWTGTDSDTVTTENAWTAGTDTVMALTCWGSSFVVFGKTQILLYVDGAGSVVGIDPTTMYVVDTIEGSGTIARDSVVKVGEGDLWYLSALGIQSIRRAVADKSNPMGAISNNIRTLITSLTASHAGSSYEIKAIHSPKDGMVLFTFPESDTCIYLDSRQPLDESGAYRAAQWTDLTYMYTACVRRDSSVYFGLDAGNIAQYSSFSDYVTGGTTAAITIRLASLWLDGGDQMGQVLKILKEAKLTLYGLGTITGTVRWAVDYRPLEFSTTFSSAYAVSGAEYSIAEYSIAEYTTGLRAREQYIALMSEGRTVKLSFVILNPSKTSRLALRDLTLYLKPGRPV